MWNKASFWSSFAGLCLASLAATASPGERYARPALARLYRRDLPLAPLFVPQHQGGNSSGAGAEGTTSALGEVPASTTQNAVAVSSQSNVISQSTSQAATLDSGSTRSFMFIPTFDWQSTSVVVSTTGRASVSASGETAVTVAATWSSGSDQFTGTISAPTTTDNGRYSETLPTQTPTSIQSSEVPLFSFSWPIISTLGTGSLTGPIDSTSVLGSGSSLPSAADTASQSTIIPGTSIASTSATTSQVTSTGVSSTGSITAPSATSSETSSESSSTQPSVTSSQSVSTASFSTPPASRPTTTPGANTTPFETLGSGATATPSKTHPLSNGAIVGIAVGVAIALILLGTVLLYLLHRRTRPAALGSPRAYPEEAYLYDPPMDEAMGPGLSGRGGPNPGFPPLHPAHFGAGGQGVPPANTGDGYNPYVPAVPAGAVPLGVGAAAHAGATRRGYAAVPTSSAAYEGYDARAPTPPQQARSPPREPDAAGESSALLGGANTARGHRPQQASIDSNTSTSGRYRDRDDSVDIRDLSNPFVDPTDPDDIARQERWPLNPRSDNGLSRPGSMSENPPLATAADGAGRPVGVSPAMREARRAWGWEK